MSIFYQRSLETFFDGDRRYSYSWDEWKYTNYFFYDDEPFRTQFDPVSFLGCRGFVIAGAELVAVWLAPVAEPRKMLDYLDAAWVSMLEDGICDYGVFAHEEWQGPFKGVQRAAMLIVNDALFDAVQDQEIRVRCGYIHQLLLHILPSAQQKYYLGWVSLSLARLRHLHSDLPVTVDLFAPTLPLGQPCAPETFLLHESYNAADCESFLNHHRSRIMPSNSWLRTEPLQGIVG